MAAPLVFNGISLLGVKLHHNKLAITASSLARRPFSQTNESTRPEFNKSFSSVVQNENTDELTAESKYNRLIGDPDYRNWKGKEEEILQDVDLIFYLTKFILHSDRYMDGERLTEDEKAVIKKLLFYHLHSDNKIGSGLDHIMVDRHPLFAQSRCLFAVRIDGGWIDFSYQKCLPTYIRLKYLSHAERFIREHFKRISC